MVQHVDAPRDTSGRAWIRSGNGNLERRLTLAITIGPFCAFVLAIPLLWSRGISGLDLTLFFVMYFISGVGLTVGYHRYFTHGSFRARPPVRIALAIAGGLGIEGGVVGWVATHRRHHALADREGDPHSPHLEETEGVLGVLRGLWHAHMGWLFGDKDTSTERWAPDLLKDRTIVVIDKLFPLWLVVSLALPALVGLAVTRSWYGMLTALLWGGLVRIFLVHHLTWSINSICHFYGSRPFESKDLSTNNWVLSVLSMGESWHNNHHAFPTSARHGLLKGQVDIAARVIQALQWLGLADDVKLPTPEQMAKKRRADDGELVGASAAQDLGPDA